MHLFLGIMGSNVCDGEDMKSVTQEFYGDKNTGEVDRIINNYFVASLLG